MERADVLHLPLHLAAPLIQADAHGQVKLILGLGIGAIVVGVAAGGAEEEVVEQVDAGAAAGEVGERVGVGSAKQRCQ